VKRHLAQAGLLLVVLVLLFAFAGSLPAQTIVTSGAVRGILTDSTGALVAGAASNCCVNRPPHPPLCSATTTASS
jgi:hypothetical protein